MPPPIPRCSNWPYSSLNAPSHFNLPRYGSRVGLHIVLFEACSTFTRVAACTLALSPIRDTLIEGFSHFVTSMTAPIASGWSGRRVGLAPTGKRRLVTAHVELSHSAMRNSTTRMRRLRPFAGRRSNRGVDALRPFASADRDDAHPTFARRGRSQTWFGIRNLSRSAQANSRYPDQIGGISIG